MIAIVVRNHMEEFHGENLSDEQMKELNPIIRNAIYTALFAQDESSKGNESASKFLAFHIREIPNYWEEPKLTDEFIKMYVKTTLPNTAST